MHECHHYQFQQLQRGGRSVQLSDTIQCGVVKRRSQGFPDHFQFHGNVHNRHRQIGNAVPPPLAKALGGQLRKALIAKQKAQQAALMAQFGI